MQKDNISFSKYGKNFQEVLAYLILEDRPFSEQIEEVLDVVEELVETNVEEKQKKRGFLASIFKNVKIDIEVNGKKKV